jgi:hypothetical protein
MTSQLMKLPATDCPDIESAGMAHGRPTAGAAFRSSV